MHLTSTSGSKIILSKSRQFNIVMTWGTIGFSMYTAEIWIFRLCHAKPYIFFFLDRYTTQQRWTFASIFTSLKCGQFNICVIWGTTRSWMYAAEICWQIHDALYKMLCDFVGVSCHSEFVELATRDLYSKSSRSRYLIEWSNEQKEKVMKEIQKYSFLKSLFSFDSD